MPIAANSGAGGSLFPLLMIALLFGVMYFMMIRPQQRRRREAEQMQNSLGPGDEVVTIGGMHGVVSAADDEVVVLEVAPDVHVRYARPAIAKVVSTASQSEIDEEEASDEVDDAEAGEVVEVDETAERGGKKD